MNEVQVVSISLSCLESDEAQTRHELRPCAIKDYAQKLRDGDSLDPALVFKIGERYVLASGFHRREAYRLAGKTEMPCEVRSGSLWDAIRAGIVDNTKHLGERLSTADKAAAIRKVLQNGPKLSNGLIAKLCGCTSPTVQKYRSELEAGAKILPQSERTGLDEKTYTVPAPVTKAGKVKSAPAVGGFAPPALLPGKSYLAEGPDGSLAMIDPHPTSEGHWFVAVFHMKTSAVDFHRQAMKYSPEEAQRRVEEFEFVQIQPWIETDSTGAFPDYLPSEQERWDQERKKLAYYDQHGRFPARDDAEFVLPATEAA